jgi:rubrerythrin
MSLPFNAAEVLEIAQQIERNGARFYRRAAETAADPHVKGLLLDLCAMEENHRRAFAEMGADLSPDEDQAPAYDPYEETVQYLRAVAGGHVFDPRADPVEWLGGGRSLAEILRRAIDMEKDSIIFYLAIRQSVPEKLGKERIEAIIREEMSHLATLSERLGATAD